jgi:hypothetical protein
MTINTAPFGNNVHLDPYTLRKVIRLEERQAAPNDWFTRDALALQKAKAEHKVREARAANKGRGPFYRAG